MAIYVEVNNVKYPAVITGRLNDRDWGNRASKAITIEMAYADAISTFVDNVHWNIIQEEERQVMTEDENVFETVIETEVFDNSEYNMAGDIIDHRNGTVTIKMGKQTAEEKLEELLKQMSL